VAAGGQGIGGRIRRKATALFRSPFSLSVLIGWAQVVGLRAQEGSQWRIYRADDGLAESFALSVTVSPRGSVWLRHPAARAISAFDGYQIRTVSVPEDANYPVHESRSGQLWSLYQGGLLEYRRDQWIRFANEDIRAEHAASAFRLVRPIPLLPAERDHVLVLLPQRLVKHNPSSGQAWVLRRADSTRLGSFVDLIEARDGGAWLTGLRGIAKLAGPVRLLTAEAEWDEHVLDPAWRVEGLSRPLEDDEGGILMTAARPAAGERVVVAFNGEQWEPPQPAPEGARLAWRGPGGALWVQAKGALQRKVEDRWTIVPIPGLARAQVFDVAVEANGIFWLATSDGLVRHAPQPWRGAPELKGARPALRALADDGAGGLWSASTAGLYRLHEGSWQPTPWPTGFTLAPGLAHPLHMLDDGRLLLMGERGVAAFDPGTGQWQDLVHPDGRVIVAMLGGAREGGVYVSTLSPRETNTVHLEVFEGRQFQALAELGGIQTPTAALRFLQAGLGDRLWLGTTNGLRLWDPTAGAFLPVPGLPPGAAHALVETPAGRLWCGGEGVIHEYDGRAWTVIQTGMGTVRALRLAPDGSVWVVGERGLLCYTDGAWLGFGPSEGLPAGGVRDVALDRAGEVYAATDEGLWRYHREADLEEPRSELLRGRTPREVPTTAPLSISFSGRDRWDYTLPERLLFATRLDDGPWSPYGSATTVTFGSLAAGPHRFAVRAMDRQRNEEAEPMIWEFSAFVPWYAEPRLLGLTFVAVVVAALLAGLAINRHLRLVRSYAEVERIVAQRTKELEQANRELLHSQKMRALGTLAAGIAHDFNNILSIIKGSAQIIEANLGDPDKVRTRVSRIQTMVEQGSGIVKAMLGLSRAPETAARPCDVNHVMTDLVRLMSDQLEPTLRIHCRPDPSLAPARGVPELIRQMLLNLILNAVDAVAGHGEIQVETAPLPSLPDDLVLAPAAADQYVRLTVRDPGHGIAAEILPRIFEPFFTTKAFSSRRGTGLGLTMVYEIAKESGLGLQVKSRPGQGSEFTVILPQA
jgi:signal transduction histidine kinase